MACPPHPTSLGATWQVENVNPAEVLPRIIILTFIGWTGLGAWCPSITLPIVPNDYYPKKERRRRRGARTRLTKLSDHLSKSLHIYYIPCVKHVLAIASGVGRFCVSVPFALADPRSPLTLIELLTVAFIASAVLQETKQLQKLGRIVYWEQSSNRLDLLHIAFGMLGLAIRLISFQIWFFAIVNATVIDPGPFAPLMNQSSSGSNESTSGANGTDVVYAEHVAFATFPLIPDSSDLEGPPFVDGLTYSFRITMSMWTILQIGLFTRLLCAFETVGVLFASLSRMLFRVRVVGTPFVLIFVAFAVCFHLFGAEASWREVWYTFIGLENTDDGRYEDRPMLMIIRTVYNLMIDITILNLMIAIMTDTYFKVARGQAVSVYRASRVTLVSDFITRSPLPQPFDLLPGLSYFMLQLLRKPLELALRLRKKKAGRKSAVGSPASTKTWNMATFVDAIRQVEDGLISNEGDGERNQSLTEHTQLVFRAQLEHLNSVRRREQKENDESAQGERIVEMQQEVKRLCERANNSSQLLLQMRQELLDQRGNAKIAWSTFRFRFDSIETRLRLMAESAGSGGLAEDSAVPMLPRRTASLGAPAAYAHSRSGSSSALGGSGPKRDELSGFSDALVSSDAPGTAAADAAAEMPMAPQGHASSSTDGFAARVAPVMEATKFVLRVSAEVAEAAAAADEARVFAEVAKASAAAEAAAVAEAAAETPGETSSVLLTPDAIAAAGGLDDDPSIKRQSTMKVCRSPGADGSSPTQGPTQWTPAAPQDRDRSSPPLSATPNLSCLSADTAATRGDQADDDGRRSAKREERRAKQARRRGTSVIQAGEGGPEAGAHDEGNLRV